MTDKAERARALETLRDQVKPGATIHTIVTHVARSGMSRSIRLFLIRDGSPWEISWLAACAMDDRIDQKNGGIKVSGAGMDMGFHLVYNLSRTLFPDGFGCIGEDAVTRDRSKFCESNDHANGDRDYTPHVQMIDEWDRDRGVYKTSAPVPTVVGLGHWHSDGGYALKHNWL